jgi:hypothetical protein
MWSNIERTLWQHIDPTYVRESNWKNLSTTSIESLEAKTTHPTPLSRPYVVNIEPYRALSTFKLAIKLAHRDKVLEALQTNELFAKPSKCTIGVASLEFCGHIIGNNRCKPTPAKVSSITEWPQPRNVHEVRQS